MGPDGRALALPYDTLVVAAGASHSYFGKDEFAEFAPGMKTIEDARYLRDGILRKFEMAEMATDPEERAEWLTFVVIGAGPTGVELVGQIAELAHTGAAAGLPLGRHRRGADPPAGGGPVRAAAVPPEAAALHPAAAGEDGRRDPAEHPGHRHGPRQHHRQGPEGRGDHPARTRIWAAGVQASPLARMLARRTGAGDRPRRPDPGGAGLQPARAPGDLRHRRHGLAEQAARRRAARHAGGQVRRQADQGPAGGTSRRRRRSSTSTRAAWPPSATRPRWPTRSA